MLSGCHNPAASHIPGNTRSAFDCKATPTLYPGSSTNPGFPLLFLRNRCVFFPEAFCRHANVPRRCSSVFQAIRDHSLPPGSRDCLKPPDRSTAADPTATDRSTAAAASPPRCGHRRSRKGKCISAAATTAGAAGGGANCSSSSGLGLSQALHS